MSNRFLLFSMVLSPMLSMGQPSDSVEVRVFGSEGMDEAMAVWSDVSGYVLAGETTSDITMADGQAIWAPGGPVGLKGFITVLDSELEFVWSFAFASDPGAPLGTPSTLAVRDVVRTPGSTVWVLYDAPREGRWQGHLLGVHPEGGIVQEFDVLSGGTVSTCALLPAGPGNYLLVGHRQADYLPSSIPSGVMAGLWQGDAQEPPGWAFVEGTEGMKPVDAAWWGGRLYVAVHREGQEDAPAAVIVVGTDNGVPQVIGMAQIADPDLVLTGITAAQEGAAWSGTVASADGTLDAAYGKLAAEPDSLDPEIWSHDWIVVTESAEDRPGRCILWTGDVLQCAGRTTTEGAGGSGAMVQRRFGPNGAWFGVHIFGGEGDEDVRDMARDGEGRLVVVGSSDSWTELTGGSGSRDAVLFRASSINLTPSFSYGEPQVVVDGAAVFVGMEEFSATDRRQAMSIQAGTPMPVEPGSAWVLYDIGGKRVAQGEGPAPMPDLPGWTRLETGTDGHPGGRWIWVRR